ncbi:hypothetical protein AB9M75_04095 [Lactobacillus sp. AN1001]
MQLGLPELINKYGDEVITDSDLTSTGGLKNKDRVIRKLNIMFEHVETSGRGRKIQFTLSGLKNEYVIDKRRENVTELQNLLLHNLKCLVSSNKLSKKPQTASQWLEILGVGKFYKGLKELYITFHNEEYPNNYWLTWEPKLSLYEDPDFEKMKSDGTVLREVDRVFNAWYSMQFKALIPKADYLGIKFSEIFVGKKKGEDRDYLLCEEEKLKLVNFVKNYMKINGYSSRMAWSSVEYKEFIRGMGYIKVYTMYTCDVNADLNFENYTMTPKKVMDQTHIQSLKEYIVGREIGKYNGLFGKDTRIPYFLKQERLNLVSDKWVLRSIDRRDLNLSIVKRLQKDYELLLGISSDYGIYKIIYSRMLYKIFKEIIKTFCGIELDDTYYNNAVEKWQKAYEKEIDSGIKLFSVMKALEG